MIRLGFLALSTLLLTSCVAPDQQPTESSVAQASTVGCADRKYEDYSCVQPTMWDPATQSTIDDFWYGASTTNPAKVMVHFETFGRLAAEVGGDETANSMYVFFVAGAPNGRNQFWKALEVKGSNIDEFQRTMINLYRPREQTLGLSVWDGGAGGPLGGSPGGHIGPHGFPLIAISDMLTLTGNMRNLYGGGINNSIRGMSGI